MSSFCHVFLGLFVKYQTPYITTSKNGIDAVLDVAISDGIIAAVDEDIPRFDAELVVDVAGLIVTPGGCILTVKRDQYSPRLIFSFRLLFLSIHVWFGFCFAGLVDIHCHFFYGHQQNPPEEGTNYANAPASLQPDLQTFRSGVTTAVDLGTRWFLVSCCWCVVSEVFF